MNNYVVLEYFLVYFYSVSCSNKSQFIYVL